MEPPLEYGIPENRARIVAKQVRHIKRGDASGPNSHLHCGWDSSRLPKKLTGRLLSRCWPIFLQVRHRSGSLRIGGQTA